MKRPVRALASPGNLTRACHKPLICQVHETWNIWSNVYFFAMQNSRNEKKDNIRKSTFINIIDLKNEINL